MCGHSKITTLLNTRDASLWKVPGKVSRRCFCLLLVKPTFHSSLIVQLYFLNLQKDAPPTAGLLFCLYLIAGFPDIISVGSTVKCSENNGNNNNNSSGSSSSSDNDGLGIVVTHFPGPDKKTLIVDLRTRKQKYKGEQLLEVS